MVSGLFSLVTLLTLAPRAFAHDGHGTPHLAGSVLHYLLEPRHLPATLIVAVAVPLAAKWVSTRRRTASVRRRV